MNQTAQRYLMNARRGRQTQFHNFVDDYHGFVNQPGGGAFAYADGSTAPAGPAASVKKSQPYAVTLSNSNAATVSNFDVLGAYQYINNAGFTAGGSLVVSGITIASAIPGVTYQELLYQSMNNPFTVGETYVSCPNATAQVQEVFTITTKDANGTQVIIPIVPNIDPYQFQNGILTTEQEYRIDGYTKMTIANILPSAIVTIRWFPSDNLNPARALGGQPVGRQYGNPGVIRSNTTVIPGAGQSNFSGNAIRTRLG